MKKLKPCFICQGELELNIYDWTVYVERDVTTGQPYEYTWWKDKIHCPECGYNLCFRLWHGAVSVQYVEEKVIELYNYRRPTR